MNSNIQFTAHFALSEFVVSQTARNHEIKNVPSPEQVENLRALCIHTLEPLRHALDLPIIITSGYRCRELNSLLAQHSDKSQHLQGQAADFHIGHTDGTDDTDHSAVSRRKLLIKAFRTIILDENINFDQCIIYPNFIHVSYVRSGKNRRKVLKANGQGGFQALSRYEALTMI